MKRICHSALSALAMGLALANAAAAQTPLTDPAPGALGQPEQAAQPEQSPGKTDIPATNIIRELAPFQNGNPGARQTVQTPRGVVVMDAARAVDLTVFFAYDSAELLPEAREQLDALGHALNAPELRDHRFLIAGHTDAKGPAVYNLDLSVRRAISVAEYLVRNHQIAPNRLVPHGWGETRLRVPSDPLSGANRRVEVVLILEQEPSSFDWQQQSLTDPRWRLSTYDLDDFGATPTN